ncbi:hypothetical protein Tco_0869484 [Tanacetum coccineum]
MRSPQILRGKAFNETRVEIRNEDLRTELEYFSKDYDEEHEMEPRPERTREVTPPLRIRSPRVRRLHERVVGFKEALNREGSRIGWNTKGNRHLEAGAEENGRREMNLPPLLEAHLGRNKNGQPLQSSLTSVHGGLQPSINIGKNLPPNGTLLSSHAQPFVPSRAHIPNGFVPTHANPYSHPSAGIINGQTPCFPFQAQTGNPFIGGTSANPPQGGYVPQTFPNSNVPIYNGFAYPVAIPTNNYPFHTQPMYAQPNMLVCPNPYPASLFADLTGSLTPFVCWIEDYPLLDGQKMPSHVGSYDGKRVPTNFLHLFEGVIPMHKWLMHVACHMFTYTLKDSARIWWNSQKAGLHEDQRISGFVHGLRTRNLVEHLSIDLPSTYKGLMEKTYTWIEAREVATNGAPNDQRDNFERSRNPLVTKTGDRKVETWEKSWAIGEVLLEITIGDTPLSRSETLNFIITYNDMTGIPRTITGDGKPFNMEHKLDEYSHIKPIKQKRQSLGPDRSTSTCKEVKELTRAGILREAAHHTWVANPVMILPKVLPGRLQRLPPDLNGRRGRGQDNILHMRRSLLLLKDALRFKKRRSNVSKTNKQGFQSKLKEISKQRTLDTRSSSSTLRNEETCGDFANAHSANIWGSSNDVSRSFDIREEGQVPIYFVIRVLQGAKLNYSHTRKAHTSVGTRSKKVAKIFLDNRKGVGRKMDTKLEEMKPSCEWKLYTDGASSFDGSGAGLMLIDPKGKLDDPYPRVFAERFTTEDSKESRKIRIKAPQYKLSRGSLYKKSYYTPWLRCIAPPKTNDVIKEIHKDVARIIQDSKKCKEQYAVRKRTEIRAISAGNAWPFSHWGVSILGPLPTAPRGLKLLAISIEHSTK